jgi:benzoylformate decarboxylase
MPVMTGKRAFLEILKQEGVELIFGNPGTTELPLMDALAGDNSIRYILALQEASVVAMADGYAQASGKLGVANLHAAPGLGNGMGMLYCAKQSGAPLVVIAGQHEQSFNRTEPILYDDLPPVARPFVKWSAEVTRLEDLPLMLHRACKVALTPPTGPVFLSLPGDVLNAEADIELGAATRVGARIRGDADSVAAAVEILARAERPVILAGSGVALTDAHAELVKLAELIGAPVHFEGEANTNAFPPNHPLFRGPIIRLTPQLRAWLDQHDVLFAVGADVFTLSLPNPINPVPPGLKIVHLDTDPWQIGKNYAADAAIFGDPKATLPEISAGVAARMSATQRRRADERTTAMTAAIVEERAKMSAQARAEAAHSPIRPLALMQAIGESLPANAVIVDETISSGVGLRFFQKPDDAQGFFGGRGGGIGWSVPGSIGIKLALPDRPVVVLVGDGSAMYTCQSLWTAAHDKIAVTVVVINNRSYRILKQRLFNQRGAAAQTDTYVGMELVDPPIDYCGLARSLGVEAVHATTLAEVSEALQRGVAGKKPLLIEAMVDGTYKPV